MHEPDNPTRRDFLRSVAAAVAAPCVITSSAVGAGGRPPPSNRIAMGFLGVGQRGFANLVRFVERPDVQVVAVCDVESGYRARAVRRVERVYRGCRAYPDFRDVIARDDLDAVCISTPEHWHAIMAIQAAKAGKDIYCEKPLSLTIREARAVVDAVERYGRVFQTGSQRRSYPGVRAACERIRSGWIGEVRTVETRVGAASQECLLPGEPVPLGLDWNMWVGPSPWRAYHRQIFAGPWRINCRDFAGGFRTDWGSHSLDIVQWGLGMDSSGPVEIHPPDGKESKTLTYVYANGVRVIESDSYDVLFKGTDGKIEVGGLGLTKPDGILEKPLGPNDVRLYASTDHRANFLECVRTRRKPVADAEVGCRSVTACHLGNIATWLGRPLRWDPVKEVFLGDEEANRWLDRPKRAPWHLD